jgi:hypothetical protein
MAVESSPKRGPDSLMNSIDGISDMRQQLAPSLHLRGGALIELARQAPEANHDCATGDNQSKGVLAITIRSASNARPSDLIFIFIGKGWYRSLSGTLFDLRCCGATW